MLGCEPNNPHQLVLAAHHSTTLYRCCVAEQPCVGPHELYDILIILKPKLTAETCLVGFPFVHLYLTDVLIALPLQEVDLFQELLLVVLEFPHGDTGARKVPINTAVLVCELDEAPLPP